jgi:hypothetical protein
VGENGVATASDGYRFERDVFCPNPHRRLYDGVAGDGRARRLRACPVRETTADPLRGDHGLTAARRRNDAVLGRKAHRWREDNEKRKRPSAELLIKRLHRCFPIAVLAYAKLETQAG